MFFAISDFTTVNRAAFFAARVAVGAVVDSSGGGIWGVSDPLPKGPGTSPGGGRGGRSRHHSLSTAIRAARAPSSAFDTQDASIAPRGAAVRVSRM